LINGIDQSPLRRLAGLVMFAGVALARALDEDHNSFDSDRGTGAAPFGFISAKWHAPGQGLRCSRTRRVVCLLACNQPFDALCKLFTGIAGFFWMQLCSK
jgi:hypothetical protein